MRTKSQRFHLCIRSIHLVVFILMMSQILYSQSALTGLGVEIGGGYNQVFFKFLLPPFNDMKFDRTQFALTPEARLKYEIPISENYNCIPFVGYNRFGGQSEESPVIQNGMKFAQHAVWFDVLEVGFFTTYIVSDFSFGIGYKANRVFKVTAVSNFPNRTNDYSDVTDGYRTWSHDAGVRVSYKLSHYSISVESLFGISDLENISEIHNIRQNHFRILLGYTI